VGTYAVTASAGGYIPQTAQVEVIGQQNTTQNFELLLNSPKIGVDPTSFEVTLELGQVTADTMTISNDGLQPLDFQLFEYPGGFSPGHAMQQINASGGPDPFGYTYADSNEPGGALYSWIDATDGTALNLDDDGEANAEMPFSFNFYGTDSTSLRIGNNGGILFNVTIGDLTYSNTDLGSATTNNLIAPFWDDMDADTGNVYYKTVGIAPYRQFIVEWFDRPHYSNVGNATFEVILYETRNDIKFQYQDVVFGDAGFDNGASATVGIREVNPNYLQYSYNQAVIQDSMAICFRYPGSIPCDVVDVPWISEQPTNGTVPVAGTADVQVTFDASAVSEPGTYTATMLIENNDPLMPVVNVPVTMHVLPTADLGRLEGTVTGLGYCDAQSNPLVADLLIENGTGNTWTVASDPTGYYFAWLPADTYTVTVSALDHLDASGVAIIVGQQTTTLDFALRFIESCMDVSPTAFTITLPVDTQLTQTLSIINNGAGDLSWEIHETTATLRTLDQNVIVNVPAISKPFVPVASRGILTSWPAREFSMHIGQVSANPINVLLVTPDVVGGGDISLLLNTLSAFPDLNVTLWDASTGTPTVSDMQAYDVVFVGNDILWTSSAIDKITLSNNMADYIDAGGKVLAGSFIWSYDDWGFGGGRFLTGAYSPFEIATTDFFIPAVLGNFDANNPLMAGITSITDNFNHQDTNLSSNGTWVASWDDGNNYVATAPNVVGLNQEYFYHADFGGQTGELLHNALLYLGAAQEWIDVPWVTEVPTSGVTLPDSTFNVEVVFNSTGLTPGECYSANLGLIHDDPGKDSPFFIPLGLCIEPPVYGVNLEPESSSGTGLPGETITYTVRITNTGNTADTFQLTYSNVDPDWTVVLPVSNFNLAAGQSVDAAVLVTIPVGAVNGDFDTFTLTATSAHEPQAFDDVEITTNVETVMFNIWLPLMYKG
jgi:uncharacterized repeat protein (TIGR01451 family)